ncbi:hypothetical protein ACLB2K_019404 [Fragaria x ananassa]
MLNLILVGGTFALYSLLCRYAKVSLTPSQQAEDRDVSNFQLQLPSKRLRRASKLKSKLESSKFAKYFLLFATMLGTSMVIGDGVLTPCISVLSAVGGVKHATSAMTDGTEALFADVGHFTVRSIQISMCSVTYPALLLAYTGQASFLREHKSLVSNTFFESIPKPLYWPMFGVAVMASIIASQAMISGTFSIIQQSLSLGFFPRVKIVHTSTKYEGQVYIPEVNYLLMLACVGVTLVFRSTTKIGNAYGIAVVFVMTLTSAFLVLIMIMIWKTHILLIISYVLVIGSVELMYLSSVLYKFDQGGYLPLGFALLLMLIMFVWNDVHRRKYYYELDHKISPEKLRQLAVDKNFCRMPGLAMFYSELVQGIPPIFNHYAENVPALHSVLVFVSIKSLPISKVPMEERFLFRRVEPRELNVFRCVARYGYTDVRNENEPFEGLLVEKLKDFIRDDFWLSQRTMHKTNGEKLEKEVSAELLGDDQELDNGNGHQENESENEDVKQILDDDEDQKKQQDDVLGTEIDAIDKAWRRGVRGAPNWPDVERTSAPSLKRRRPSVRHRQVPTMARLHPSGLQQRPRSLSLPCESAEIQFSGEIT